MCGVNKVILIGNLLTSPDMRVGRNGNLVVSFLLVTPDSFVKNGNRVKHDEQHHIVMRRGVAVSAASTLTKGKLIYLEGKIVTRSSPGETGADKYITEIIAECFKVLGRSSDFSDGNYLPADIEKT